MTILQRRPRRERAVAIAPNGARHERGLSKELLRTGLNRLALLALVLLAWEVSARALDSNAIPGAASVMASMVTTVPSGAFWAALGATMQGWLIGMGVAAAIGIPLGLAMGANDLAMRATRGIIEFMRTVPAIMLVPLVVLMLGSTVEMKVVLIALAAVWPLLIQAGYGFRSIDAVARESAQVFHLTWRDRVVYLYVPSALPVIATGLRIAATVSLLISIGAEIVTSAPGIGYEIVLRQANNDAPKAFVYVLLAGVLGVAINLTFGALERRAMFWHASQRSKAVTP